MTLMRLRLSAWLAMASLQAPGAGAAEPADPLLFAQELKTLSLEELLQQEVSLVTRTPQNLFVSPSPAQVISGNDVRRSGASSLPEALRLAPNLHVAQQNSYTWAITARGFNGAALANNSLANKLLVMIDGRSIYTPLFWGVFWDVQNVLLEDLDQIEVVSGPGGTLWGANAVNGVINIVTKNARDTQGTYIAGGGGSFLQDFGAVRYGGQAGSNLFYRVYGQRLDWNSTELQNGTDANDAWHMTQGGVRLDYFPSEATTVTLQSDIYSGSQGDPVVENIDGQNVLGRWTHRLSDTSDFWVQVYFDRTWRDLPTPSFADELITYDIDFQHRFALGHRQQVVWGAGYRLMENTVNNSPLLSFVPAKRIMQLFSGFVQDEIALVPDRLTLTLGTKLEHNEFSGLEVQPSAKIAWTPADRHTVWAAVTRAVRSPSRFDSDAVFSVLDANQIEFDSEKLLAGEIGYRIRPVDRLSLSFAGFYNQYEDLRSLTLSPNPPPPFAFGNDMEGDTWGMEFAGTMQVSERWRIRGGYTWFRKDLRLTSPDAQPVSERFEANDPEHQWLLHSMLDLPGGFELDLVGRYVSDLRPDSDIPAYFTFDARLGWTWRQLELSLIGKNLWDNAHPEFGSPGGIQEIPRSVYGQVTLRF